MADEQFQDKTLEPTDRKLAKAREEGQLPRSRDLNTAMIMIAGVVMLMFFSKHVMNQLMENMQIAFAHAHSQSQDLSHIGATAKLFLIKTVIALLPFFIAVYAFSLVGPAVISGIHFLPKAMKIKTERLNLFKGLKRLFSLNSLMELFKSLGKFLVILAVAIGVLYLLADKIIMSGVLPFEKGIQSSFESLRFAVIALACSLLLFAAIDVPYQKWEFKRKMRMSHKELKDELKETEGNPELKQTLKRKQMHLARQRMMREIPKATIVITNPDHYAVALKYEKGSHGAPQVVAKGVDWMAETIKQIAKQHDVPIMRAPPLARAIYYNTELFDEIPGGLYQAVAKILAYVYQLRAYKVGAGPAPTVPEEFSIPEDLRREQ